MKGGGGLGIGAEDIRNKIVSLKGGTLSQDRAATLIIDTIGIREFYLSLLLKLAKRGATNAEVFRAELCDFCRII